MKYISIILLIFFTSNLCFAYEHDEKLSQKIIGLWEVEMSNGDLSIKATENYKADGTLVSTGLIYINNNLAEEYLIKSKWIIKNGYAQVEVLESTNSKLMPAGHKWSDKIISVDENVFTFEKKNGKQTTMKRKK